MVNAGGQLIGRSSLTILIASGEGHWHARDGEFAYIRLHLDELAYNVSAEQSPLRIGSPV